MLESHIERRPLQVHENPAILRGLAEGSLHVRIGLHFLGKQGQRASHKNQAGQEKEQFGAFRPPKASSRYGVT